MKVLCALVLLCFASVALAATGIITVNCHTLTQQRADPIVTPGVAGTHTHTIIGGNAFKRDMAGRAAESATATTCDKALDNSNYWVPSLYHYENGQYELVEINHAAVYYLKRACSYDPKLNSCDGDNSYTLAFPYGFRMVAGDPSWRSQNMSNFAQKAVDLVCLGGNQPEQGGFPKGRCDAIRAQVFFPSCWDGKNIDSPNHKDHVAYPAKGDYNTGVCPQSHPVALISIFFEFFFETKKYTDFNRFAFANGDPTGYGFHGDFIMGWTDRDKLQAAHASCNGGADCPILGNQPGNPQKLMYPAIYEEEIGLNGPIPKLPGNNPINWPAN